MGEYRNVNLVLGETLSVFTKAELIEPARNLVHRGTVLFQSAYLSGQLRVKFIAGILSVTVQGIRVAALEHSQLFPARDRRTPAHCRRTPNRIGPAWRLERW
jgi:hypothetical protein